MNSELDIFFYIFFHSYLQRYLGQIRMEALPIWIHLHPLYDISMQFQPKLITNVVAHDT